MQLLRNRYSLFINRYTASLGLSLVEYIIAVSLGLMVALLFFEVYRGMKISHHFIESLYKGSLDAKTLISFITNEVHISGNMGCEKISKAHPIYNNMSGQFQLIEPIRIDHSAIHFTHTQPDYGLLKQHKMHQAYFDISSSMIFHPDDMIVISDCIHTEAARIMAIQKMTTTLQRLYIKNPLHFHFLPNAQVSKLVTVDIFLQRYRKQPTIILSINYHRTPIADSIDNLIFSKSASNSVAFQFESMVGKFKKKWYGYAAIR